MKTHTKDITDMLKKTDNVENSVSLEKQVDLLFKELTLDDGIKKTQLFNAAINIDLSTKTNAQQPDIPIISKFKFNTLYKYKRPVLTTVNVKLQNYIEATTPELANEWINKFEEIYNRYILKKKEMKLDNRLLSVNVNNINMENSGTSLPTKEIFIKLTLIDGEVNDTNKSDIYCPITNNMLGTELLHLIEDRTDNANLLKEDVSMFVVNSKQTTIGYNNQPQQTPKNNGPTGNNNYIVANEAADKFGPIIIKSADQKKLGEIVDEIRKRSNPGLQLTTDSILAFINTTYADSLIGNKDQYSVLPDLPSAINEWGKNARRSNTTLQDRLTAMKSALDTNYGIINDKLTGSKPIVDNADRNKLSTQLANIRLYSYIVELLVANEKTKVITAVGGKLHKKKRRKTIKCKSKPRHKTHKRRNF
jgi:hypothetical protein